MTKESFLNMEWKSGFWSTYFGKKWHWHPFWVSFFGSSWGMLNINANIKIGPRVVKMKSLRIKEWLTLFIFTPMIVCIRLYIPVTNFHAKFLIRGSLNFQEEKLSTSKGFFLLKEKHVLPKEVFILKVIDVNYFWQIL